MRADQKIFAFWAYPEGATTHSTKNMRTKTTTTLKEKNNSANNIAWTCFLWERLLVPEAHPEYIFNNEGGAGAAGYEQRRVGCFDFTSVSDCSNRCCLFVGHLLKKHLSFSTKIMMENRFGCFFSPAFSTCCCYCCCFLKIVHNALNAKRCLDGARPLANNSHKQLPACPQWSVSLGSPSHLSLALPLLASGLCGVAN